MIKKKLSLKSWCLIIPKKRVRILHINIKNELQETTKKDKHHSMTRKALNYHFQRIWRISQKSLRNKISKVHSYSTLNKVSVCGRDVYAL